MDTPSKSRYTPQEYLAFERMVEYKNEYRDGQIYPMPPANIAHNILTVNIGGVLHDQLRGRPCHALMSAMRIHVVATGLYAYPDVLVFCGKAQVEDEYDDTLLNPTAIFEVLSPSTEAYDRGEKFSHYRRLACLTDYVLVAQDRVRLEHYVRQGDGWLLTELSDRDDMLRLETLACELPLAEIYGKVKFPERAAEEV